MTEVQYHGLPEKPKKKHIAYTELFLSLHEDIKEAEALRREKKAPRLFDPLLPREGDSQQTLLLIREFCDHFTLDCTISGDPIGYLYELPEKKLLILNDALNLKNNVRIAARFVGYLANLMPQERFERLKTRYTGAINELYQTQGLTLPSIDQNPPSLTSKGIDLNR